MKSKFFLWAFFLILCGCTLFPLGEYRFMPYNTDASLLRNYQYISHTATSVVYEVKISSLAWYSDETDFRISNNYINMEGDGTFKIIDNTKEEVDVFDNASTILLLDQSGSFSEIDPHNNRTKAINKFLEGFIAPNNFLVGGFSKMGNLISEPVEYADSDFKSVWVDQEFLYGLAGRTGGTSSLLDAIDDAIDKLSDSPSPNRNLVVMLHGPDDGSTATISNVIAKANLNTIKIHVLILGSLTAISEGWQLAEQTGGMLAVCRTDGELTTVFDHMQRLLHWYSSVTKLRIEFSPTGGVVSGNEYENLIKLTSYSDEEMNPVYVKVKIP